MHQNAHQQQQHKQWTTTVVFDLLVIFLSVIIELEKDKHTIRTSTKRCIDAAMPIVIDSLFNVNIE